MNQSSTFLDMPLSDGMKQTVKNIGFTAPTAIQEKAIPELLLGKDLLGQAQTGTGKTAAFAIPLIEMVNDQNTAVQALVVCPTRELCLQICQELKRLSEHKPYLKTVALYGGQSIEQQFRALKSDLPQIIIATPGRLFDHLRRKSIALSTVGMIVLDEADEMLDMGFRPEIEEIFALLPDENQRIFFSATMPKAIKDMACTYLREPCIVKVESKTLTVSTIEQSFLKVRGREKTDLLCRLIEHRNPKLAVVFCNAKLTADEIVDDLVSRGFEAGVLHGDLSQNQRDRVMAKFKMGSIRTLVATDVAARGLDIDDVELVVNYHLPHDPEDYVHRIGRTGRAGRKGVAISLVEPRDNSRLRRISMFAKVEIREEQPPSFSDIKKAKIESFFTQVKNALSSEKIREYRSVIAKQTMPSDDIAAAMLQMAMKRLDERPQNDLVFAELNEREYTGMNNADKRFNDRDRRPPVRGRKSSFDRGERGENRFGRKFGDRDRDRDGQRSSFRGEAGSRQTDAPRQNPRENNKGFQSERSFGPQRGPKPFPSRPRPANDDAPRRFERRDREAAPRVASERFGNKRAKPSDSWTDAKKGSPRGPKRPFNKKK